MKRDSGVRDETASTHGTHETRQRRNKITALRAPVDEIPSFELEETASQQGWPQRHLLNGVHEDLIAPNSELVVGQIPWWVFEGSKSPSIATLEGDSSKTRRVCRTREFGTKGMG